MYRKDYRDIIAGSALLALGLGAAIHAGVNMPVGSARHMGPGWFPLMLGLLLAGLGAFIALPAFFRGGTLDRFDLRQFLAVCGATLAFALAIRPLGLVPAIVLLTAIAVTAERKLGPLQAALLASAMSVGAVLIFIYGLGMPIRIVNWTF